MTLPKDPIKREEYIRGISERMSGEKHYNYGKHLSDEHRKNQSDSLCGEKHPFYGKHHTKETCDKISATLLKIHPGRGVPLSENHKRKISKSNMGKKSSREQRIKLSCIHRGIPISEFNGFQHVKPYCELWTPEFKERVRIFFGRRCVECQKTEEENGRKLDVHHVNYDKQTCCKEGESVRDRKFVALCQFHNLASNYNREYWEQYYTMIINENYSGQCYLPKIGVSTENI